MEVVPTLCLSMIVKNESKIIKRLFESVVKHIDAYCICDTGSTDETVAIIESYFKDHPHIKGRVIHEPFQDFSHNRNVALRNSEGLSDYVLLLDADMVLEWKDFNKASLSRADAFTVLQGTPGFMYRNNRIIRNDPKFSYKGATHEYLDTPPHTVVVALPFSDIFILDIGDGGSKSDKVERDTRLLLASIEKDPENERSLFYLANTYFDSGQYDLAEKYYHMRITKGGWVQEVWYCWYRLGLIAKAQEKPEKAIGYWLEGFQVEPRRIENMYEIIKHYRVSGKAVIAKPFYEKAALVARGLSEHEKSEFLFFHNDVYTHHLAYEWTILAFYNGVKDIRREWLCLFKYTNDWNMMNSLIRNMSFYTFSIPINRTDNFTMTMVHQNTMLWSSSPSLLPDNSGGYLMNVRFVNYAYDKETGFCNVAPPSTITLNTSFFLDSNFTITSIQILPLTLTVPLRLYHGVEDVRLFRYPSGEIRFIGTALQKINKLGVVVGKYPDDIDNPRELYQRFNLGPACEKNWTYVFPQGETEPLIVYRWHPIQICRLPPDGKDMEVYHEIATPPMFCLIRGSSCGVRYQDEIWFVVHFVSYETSRRYYHLLLVFDEEMTELVALSAPFTFENNPIEYCIGFVVEKERFILAYSTWDQTSKIATIPRSSLEMFRWKEL